MSKIFLVLLLLTLVVQPLLAQNDMTIITTTGRDNMEGSEIGRFDWAKIKTTPILYKTELSEGGSGGGGHVVLYDCYKVQLILLLEFGYDSDCVLESNGNNSGGAGNTGSNGSGNSGGNGSGNSGGGNNGGSGGGGGGVGSGSSGSTATPVAPPPTISITLESDVIIKVPVPDTTRKDTVKPTKVPCDSAKTARGAYVTNLLNNIENTSDMDKFRDSSKNGKFENAIALVKDSSGKIVPSNLHTDSSKGNVNMPTTNTNLIAWVHNHLKGKNNSPSPGDFYHLLEGNKTNNNFNTEFVIAEDGSEFAIMIDNGLNASLFLNEYPKDSTIKNGEWNDSLTHSQTGHTFNEDYYNTMRNLYEKLHYPMEIVAVLANLLILNEYNKSGIKIFQKVNSEFKELSYNPLVTVDHFGNENSEIQICK